MPITLSVPCPTTIPDSERAETASQTATGSCFPFASTAACLGYSIGRSVARFADEDPVERPSRLEAGSGVDHAASDEALACLRPRPDGYECLPRVHRDPHVHGVLFERPVADREGCSHGALGVVLAQAALRTTLLARRR
jgi:hypothetical protein